MVIQHANLNAGDINNITTARKPGYTVHKQAVGDTFPEDTVSKAIPREIDAGKILLNMLRNSTSQEKYKTHGYPEGLTVSDKFKDDFVAYHWSDKYEKPKDLRRKQLYPTMIDYLRTEPKPNDPVSLTVGMYYLKGEVSHYNSEKDIFSMMLYNPVTDTYGGYISINLKDLENDPMYSLIDIFHTKVDPKNKEITGETELTTW